MRNNTKILMGSYNIHGQPLSFRFYSHGTCHDTRQVTYNIRILPKNILVPNKTVQHKFTRRSNLPKFYQKLLRWFALALGTTGLFQ